MDINNDSAIVVMGRSVFDELMYLAGIGESEMCSDDLVDVRRHLRKFNTALAEEHQADLKQREEKIRKAKAEGRNFLKQHVDKTVYRQVGKRAYKAGVLKSLLGKQYDQVILRNLSTGLQVTAFISEIQLVLPTGYVLETEGPNAGRYIPGNETKAYLSETGRIDSYLAS